MELHQELERSISDSGNGIVFINHPLVHIHFGGSEIEIEWCNKSLEIKKLKLQEFFESKRWANYIFLHERPYRLEAFNRVSEGLSGREYWSLLGEIWTDSENIWQFDEIWRSLFTGGKYPEERVHFMTNEEQEVLSSLPDQIVVYRGYNSRSSRDGMSFTTSRKTAKFFADRYCTSRDNSYVVEGKVSKSAIFAYKGDRGEDEIILLDPPEKSVAVDAIKFKI